MKFKTKLWRRGKMSFATTVPRIVLLNLDPSQRIIRSSRSSMGVYVDLKNLIHFTIPCPLTSHLF